ncbi:unnamed protein product [Closterium sp. Yama58-4]|nr:unnamed protein product [Closterium sp. Yama58-4]
MGGVSEEAAIATFLDPRLKTVTLRIRARGARSSAPIVVKAGDHARGARALDLDKEMVKAQVRERLPPYQAAARAAAEARLGGEVAWRARLSSMLFAELAKVEAEEGVRAHDEVDQYLAEAIQEDGCSLVYWSGREQQLPGLRAMARDYLGILATSAVNGLQSEQEHHLGVKASSKPKADACGHDDQDLAGSPPWREA